MQTVIHLFGRNLQKKFEEKLQIKVRKLIENINKDLNITFNNEK